jgi:hypothetical protein
MIRHDPGDERLYGFGVPVGWTGFDSSRLGVVLLCDCILRWWSLGVLKCCTGLTARSNDEFLVKQTCHMMAVRSF